MTSGGVSRAQWLDLCREVPSPDFGSVFAAVRERDWVVLVDAWPSRPWRVTIKRDGDDYESSSHVGPWPALVRAFLAACRGGRFDPPWDGDR